MAQRLKWLECVYPFVHLSSTEVSSITLDFQRHTFGWSWETSEKLNNFTVASPNFPNTKGRCFISVSSYQLDNLKSFSRCVWHGLGYVKQWDREGKSEGIQSWRNLCLKTAESSEISLGSCWGDKNDNLCIEMNLSLESSRFPRGWQLLLVDKALNACFLVTLPKGEKPRKGLCSQQTPSQAWLLWSASSQVCGILVVSWKLTGHAY
jgi:hypothetical protein